MGGRGAGADERYHEDDEARCAASLTIDMHRGLQCGQKRLKRERGDGER
jgi:hypothetical protein